MLKNIRSCLLPQRTHSGTRGKKRSESQVQRSFFNKKTRLLEKTDRRTGNVQPNLSEDEKEFEKFLQGEDPLQSKTVRTLSFGDLRAHILQKLM